MSMRRVQGLTVLEVLIGVTLLVLGVVPVLALFSSQEQESGIIAERLLVTNHLRRQLDRLESRAVATHFAQPSIAEGPQAAMVGGKTEGLALEEKLELAPSDLVPGLYEAKVSATWQDPTGKATARRDLSLTRLVVDPERGAAHRDWPPRAPAAGAP